MLCEDIHSALAPILERYDSDQICFVIDEKIAAFLPPARYRNGVNTILLPVLESHKSLDTVQRIWDFFFRINLTRRGLVVCVGGGVLTDMAGFAAATYKRGVGYVNIPTTLLAMVDASTGGKTGVNYHGLKNSIGVFAQPVATLICPSFLTSLPSHEMLSGYAEMLKTALLDPSSDTTFIRLLQYDLDTMDANQLAPLIADCVSIKEYYVASDPLESGLRKALNLGHTFAHALEEISLSGDSRSTSLSHGYAVLYGLIAELYLSVTLLGCPREPLQQLTSLMLHYYGKPKCNCSDRERLIGLMRQDKKNEQTSVINCTLLHAIGKPALNTLVSPEQALEAWEYLFSL